MNAKQFFVGANEVFINNDALPVVHYSGVFAHDSEHANGDAMARLFEALFQRNQWPPRWRSGIFDFHHFHSSSHEVLGAYEGAAELQFGGDTGPRVRCRAGDVVLIPAGVAHRRAESGGTTLRCVGAYPRGARPDQLEATACADAGLAARIRAVPAPTKDPVLGDTRIGPW